MDGIICLVMKGGDRISRNTDALYGREKNSYSQETEGWSVMADTEDKIGQVVDRMFAEELIGRLIARRREGFLC